VPDTEADTEEGLMADHVAVAETEINASADDVWVALTDPEEIEKYMFGLSGLKEVVERH
jgi:uncharacterized protein YndB with AHSA1/START domain